MLYTSFQFASQLPTILEQCTHNPLMMFLTSKTAQNVTSFNFLTKVWHQGPWRPIDGRLMGSAGSYWQWLEIKDLLAYEHDKFNLGSKVVFQTS